MPTLLQINVDANNGSNGSIARDIGTKALARGWESYIAYGRRSIPCDSHLLKIGNKFDLAIHGFRTRLLDQHGLGSVNATKRFLKTVDVISPDIVHLHNIHGYYINYRLLFEYLIEKDIPIVWTFHDCWPFTGHCGYFESYACTRWKSICYNCPAKSSYPSSMIFDNSTKSYKLKKKLFTSPRRLEITTVSKWLKGLVEESYFAKFPIQCVYNGIDTDSFTFNSDSIKSEYEIEDKTLLMSAAANWSKSKGWDDYIALSKILPENYVIMLVGVTEQQRKELPPNIIGVGRLESKAELARYYSSADVLLNLSYQETFGMTTAEAMSCGTPGISYDRTACPEILSADTGIVVEAGNLEQVKHAVAVMESKGKSHYSEGCRQRVLDNFNSATVNETFFEIYNRLLSEQ